MTDDDRALWITILDAAARGLPDQMNNEWVWLLKQLGLPSTHFLALHAAVQQRRWRTAKNPRAYLKTVAKREAIKMGLLSEGSNDLVFLDANDLEVVAHEQGSSEAMKGSDGIWRRGEGWNDDYDPRSEFGSYREFLMSGIPSDLKTVTPPSKALKKIVDKLNEETDEFHIHLKAWIKPNWRKWAKAAGFSKWELVVLDCRCAGKSREKALSEQSDEHSRRSLQAAWKKFDRTGKERLRKAIKKIPPENVPE